MNQMDQMNLMHGGNLQANPAAAMFRAEQLAQLKAAYCTAHEALCRMAMVRDPAPESALRAMAEFREARTAYALARLEQEQPPRV